MSKGKHLTIEDRSYVEDALRENYSLALIAKRLEKDPTTISKEIKRNRVPSKKRRETVLVSCQNKNACIKKHICSDSCKELCKKCKIKNCYRICPDYTDKKCVNLRIFPHVCNGCSTRLNCHLEKYKYVSKVAQANYESTLKSSREGISMSESELNTIDEIISPLVKRGQSLKHIYINHDHEISCSERTLYNYFEQNFFTARNIDLPRKVRYKPRKKKPQANDKTPSHRIGRSYDDFTNYLAENPNASVVEMDTVHGKKGEKVLLTLLFRNSSLMVAILLEKCTQKAVKEAIDEIYESVGLEVFRNSFPVILTDNGPEFKSPELLEYDDMGNERTKVFYCDPLASYQKPHVEKNHEYIRYILPKKKSFEDLTQEKVTLMMNHINSTARASLNNYTPFKLAQILLDEALLDSLSFRSIPADNVHLKPLLLKY